MNSIAVVQLMIALCVDKYPSGSSVPGIDTFCLEAVSLKSPETIKEAAKAYHLYRECDGRASRQQGRDQKLFDSCMKGQL